MPSEDGEGRIICFRYLSLFEIYSLFFQFNYVFSYCFADTYFLYFAGLFKPRNATVNATVSKSTNGTVFLHMILMMTAKEYLWTGSCFLPAASADALVQSNSDTTWHAATRDCLHPPTHDARHLGTPCWDYKGTFARADRNTELQKERFYIKVVQTDMCVRTKIVVVFSCAQCSSF